MLRGCGLRGPTAMLQTVGESVKSLLAGPPVSDGEWTARSDGGPSIRTRVEPEGHRKAPPPVPEAPRREMWGFSFLQGIRQAMRRRPD